MRPRFSVGGTRWYRWPPASSRKSCLAPLPWNRTATNPGRSSRSSASKTPPLSCFDVGGEMVLHEEAGVFATLSRSNLDDDGFHIPLTMRSSLA